MNFPLVRLLFWLAVGTADYAETGATSWISWLAIFIDFRGNAIRWQRDMTKNGERFADRLKAGGALVFQRRDLNRPVRVDGEQQLASISDLNIHK